MRQLWLFIILLFCVSICQGYLCQETIFLISYPWIYNEHVFLSEEKKSFVTKVFKCLCFWRIYLFKICDDIIETFAHYKLHCHWTRTHNHLVHKRTLNHLAKLAKWLSTYLYGAFDCMLLSCHVECGFTLKRVRTRQEHTDKLHFLLFL